MCGSFPYNRILVDMLVCCVERGSVPTIRSSNEPVLIKTLLRKYNGMNLSQNSNISLLFQKNENVLCETFSPWEPVRYLEIEVTRLWQQLLRLDYLAVFESHTHLPCASSKLSVIACFITPVLALEVVYAPPLLFCYSLNYNLRQLCAYDLGSLDLRSGFFFLWGWAWWFPRSLLASLGTRTVIFILLPIEFFIKYSITLSSGKGKISNCIVFQYFQLDSVFSDFAHSLSIWLILK